MARGVFFIIIIISYKVVDRFALCALVVNFVTQLSNASSVFRSLAVVGLLADAVQSVTGMIFVIGQRERTRPNAYVSS